MSAIVTAITTRATGTNGVDGVTVKNSPLSNAEIDNNFINLNHSKLEQGDLKSTNTFGAGVTRDGSGNFSANIITAALSGNASTATVLQTPRNINGQSFDGSATIFTPCTYDSAFKRFTAPGGGIFTTTTSSHTGAIAITLPNGMTNGMVTMTVKIYEYSTNRMFEVHIGGYMYSVGNTWVNNPSAYVVGNADVDRRFTVRFGYNAAGKGVVYIGETSSTWSYPQIFVTEFGVGYSGMAESWATGWTVGFATTFENVTATITNSQVGWTAQSLQTANNYQVNSMGVGTAANGTAGRFDASNVVTTSLTANGSAQISSLGIGTPASGTAGETRATNAITSYYSDKRLKEEISKIENALAKVNQLTGVVYKQNKLAEDFGYFNYEEQVGLYAQDVKSVQPQAVKPAPFDIETDDDGNDYSKSGQDYLTVQYDRLVPLLVEAIKELSQEVEKIKQKVN